MRHSHLFRRFTTAITTIMFTGSSLLTGQEFKTWDPQDGGNVWESPTNWNPTETPDTISEGARINSGTVNVGSSFTIGALELKAQSANVVMNQSNEMTTSRLVVDGGQISGTGTMRVTGGGGNSSTGLAIINSASQPGDGPLTMIMNGSFDVGRISLQMSPLIQNQDTFIFGDGDEIGDTNLINLSEPLPTTFENTGFLRKEGGTGSATFSPRFVNENQFASISGTLLVNGGGINRGTFRTEAPGVLQFGGRDVIFENGSAISGTGTTVLRGSRFEILSGVVVPVSNFTMEFTTSRIAGAGEFSFSGNAIQIDAGQLRDTVTVRIQGGATMNLSGGLAMHESSHVIVDSGGIITVDGSNAELINWGESSLTNNGTIDFQNDGDIDNNGPIAPSYFMTFLNNGILKKTGGTQTTTVVAIFENNGEFSSSSGIMHITSEGINRGEFKTEGDGQIRITSGDLVFEDGSSISGTGLTRLNGGYIKAAAGAVIPTNNFSTDSTTSRMGGSGEFQLSGSNLEIDSGQTVDDVTIRLLQGSSLVVSGGLSMHGTSSLIFEPGTNITFTQNGSTFVNSGTTSFQNAGVITIEADGDITNNGPVDPVSSFMAFHNEGVVRKTGGTGSTVLSNILENDGEIFSGSGTITLVSRGTNRGELKTEGDGIIRITSSDLTFENGSSISGTGLTRLSSGFIKAAAGAVVPVNNILTDSSGSRLGGDGEFQLSGSSLEFKSGRLLENVTVRVLDGASLEITGGFSLTDKPTLINDPAGLITLTASNSALVSSGESTLRNDGSIIYADDGDINNNGPLTNDYGLAIENNGTILKNGGTGESNLAFRSYSGNGLLRVETGTIRVGGVLGTSVFTGTIEVLPGTTLRGSSNLGFAAGSNLSGTGTLRATNVNFGGTTSPGMSIGTLGVTGNSTFTDTSNLEVELGAGGAADSIAATNNATIDGDLTLILDGGVVPFDGDSWTILTATSVTGIFDTVIAPAAAEGFGYFLDYNSNNVTVNYEFIGFRRAVEQALGISIPANADLDDYVGLDSDGDGKTDLLEWALGTSIGTADAEHRLEVVSFDEQTPQTVRFRAPTNPLALDVILELEVADSPEGTYTVVNTTPLAGQDEVIDGVLYQSFEATLTGGPEQARFFRLTARLGAL